MFPVVGPKGILRRRAGRACPAIAILVLAVFLQSDPVAGQPFDPAALSGEGPWEVSGYNELPIVEEFADATIFFPWDAPEPVGGIAIAPGFAENQSHIWWWGARLASHGYAVILIDTNDPREPPEDRATALMAGLRTLQMENGRPDGPLFGRLDPERLAVAGHSMGGGGALLAAQLFPDRLRAAVPFAPWLPNPEFPDLTVPTLIIAGEADRVAGVAAHAWPHFQAIPESTPKVYLEVADGDHFISDTNRGADLDMLGSYVVAWLGLYLDGDERYRDLIYGDRPDVDRGRFSRYVENP